ncbi:DUF4240 domain-containing protein [Rhodocytophaga aerolata]|uniref:DUF4240 domain-containing protein n=1 Tax=Rhodocytophaga aerolata TaxID=455078 RepID=A0ABT8R0T5_9BACT|nr:DUF4240 domain-containing protein [Rhodocytophaga aerolata]MDO1445701.1 DUF4240 domain-containing protein [Rhodocytophaga aerolata]
MNEQKFWEIIEASWEKLPMLNGMRQEALQTNEPDLFEGLSFGLEDEVVEELEQQLAQLSKEDLTKFIRIMEEKLHNIDREEIHAHTDGSDDGFLYCRGFIVGMGERYYTFIDQNPTKAMLDTEAESVCFAGYEVYQSRFGEEFERNTIHRTESGSNPHGWRE